MPHPTCQTIRSTLRRINPKRSLIFHSIKLTCSDEEVCSVTPAKVDTLEPTTNERDTTHQLFTFIKSKKISAHSSYRLKPSNVQASSKASCIPIPMLNYFFRDEN